MKSDKRQWARRKVPSVVRRSRSRQPVVRTCGQCQQRERGMDAEWAMCSANQVNCPRDGEACRYFSANAAGQPPAANKETV